MQVEFKPFQVPNFARLDVPYAEDPPSAPGIALRDVPAEDLEKLCVRFRAEVFDKAGRIDPAIQRPKCGVRCKCGEIVTL